MIYIIIFLLILLGYWYGLSLFFKKAGKTSWHAFVPYLRIKALTEIFEKKQWKWILMSFIPVVNFFVYSNLLGEISNSLRRYSFWEHTLAVVFGWAWLPFILQKDEEKFHGINGESDGYKAPKLTRAREWTDALLFALFAAYFIRTFVFEIYTIPTSSMEGTLKVGDFLVVSKFAYGARIPQTPLYFPLVHHSFPKGIPIIGGKKSYLEWIKLPYKRLPKFQEIKRNDMVVFNFPANDTTTKEYDSAYPYYDLVRDAKRQGIAKPRQYINDKFTVITRPVDKRENYIKRCVGIAGDKLDLRQGVLYINDKIAYEAENAQFTYILTGKREIIAKGEIINGQETYNLEPNFKKALFAEGEVEFEYIDSKSIIYIYTNKTKAEKIRKLKDVSNLEIHFHNSEEDFVNKEKMYPNTTKAFRNNVDNYGPIVIPAKGMTVKLNKENYLMYQRCIAVYEGNELEIKNGKAFINGKEATEYTFKMDYYWMMGDNRHRSQDSRLWGFVPEDHIVGKAGILLASNGKYDGFRWNRVFKSIHGKWAPKEKKFTD
ncbi:MAG: signal peptidase I [Chitinophagales bacterium]